jgi:hypothetical protein
LVCRRWRTSRRNRIFLIPAIPWSRCKGAPIANNRAFIEYDLAIISADHGSELVIEKLLAAVFDVFRESDPVADCQCDLLSLEHIQFPFLVEWQLLLGGSISILVGGTFLAAAILFAGMLLRRRTFLTPEHRNGEATPLD